MVPLSVQLSQLLSSFHLKQMILSPLERMNFHLTCESFLFLFISAICSFELESAFLYSLSTLCVCSFAFFQTAGANFNSSSRFSVLYSDTPFLHYVGIWQWGLTSVSDSPVELGRSVMSISMHPDHSASREAALAMHTCQQMLVL